MRSADALHDDLGTLLDGGDDVGGHRRGAPDGDHLLDAEVGEGAGGLVGQGRRPGQQQREATVVGRRAVGAQPDGDGVEAGGRATGEAGRVDGGPVRLEHLDAPVAAPPVGAASSGTGKTTARGRAARAGRPRPTAAGGTGPVPELGDPRRREQRGQSNAQHQRHARHDVLLEGTP